MISVAKLRGKSVEDKPPGTFKNNPQISFGRYRINLSGGLGLGGLG